MPRHTGILLFSLLLISCQSLSLNASERVLRWHRLPPELAETSALVCDGADLLTLNDSGNPAHVYRIDRQGTLQEDYSLDARNQDWEALAADDQALYVADIGDNFGNREQLQIYRLPRPLKETTGKQQVQKLTIRYPDRPSGKLSAYAHDFDAEALAAADGKLWLFSKSWQTTRLRIYSLSPTEAHQVATLEATVEGLPGLITAADYDPRRQRWWLAGYSTVGGISFSPFVAELDREFQVQQVRHLGISLQVEGLCVADDGGLWLSAEKGLSGSAVLFQFDVDTESSSQLVTGAAHAGSE